MTKVNFKCPHCGETTEVPVNVRANIGCGGVGCSAIVMLFLALVYMSQIEGCVTHVIRVWHSPAVEVAE